MRKMIWLLLLTLLLTLACQGRGKKTPAAQATLPFPSVEIPQMMEDPAERIQWAVTHFWDKYTDTAFFHPTDSAVLNGVAREEMEKQVGLYTTLLQQTPREMAVRGMERLFARAEAFNKAHPEAGLMEGLGELLRKYLYDPTSPVRDESLWLPYVEGLCASPLTDPDMLASYRWEQKVCRLNLPGTPAADFAFTDLGGRVRHLYDIQAEYTVLIFGNPDCAACRELTAAFRGDEGLSSMIASGKVKVVDIYIDEDIDAWKAGADNYPTEWINGYDHLGRISADRAGAGSSGADRIYAVRAIPSIYLLDADKTVLLKDTPEDRLLNRLATL